MFSRPTLVISRDRVEKNVKRVLRAVEGTATTFRPHFKTHQSREVGRWTRALGVSKITVATFDQVKYFVEDGWDDILLAQPFNILQAKQMSVLLLERPALKLGVLVDSADQIPFLRGLQVEALIELDAGYRRSGVPIESVEEVISMARHIASLGGGVTFGGLYCHAGDSYHKNDDGAIFSVFDAAVEKLCALRTLLEKEVVTGRVKIVFGDTPTISVHSSSTDEHRRRRLTLIDEVTSGNLFLYDLQQHSIGSCRSCDIAAVAALPVLSKHPERSQAVAYGGSAELNKDFMLHEDGITKVFGRVCGRITRGDNEAKNIESIQWGEGPTPGVFLSAISQELGVVTFEANAEAQKLLSELEIGDILLVLPVHSCLAVCNLNYAVSTTGERIDTIRSGANLSL